jgi:hypothetical protein
MNVAQERPKEDAGEDKITREREQVASNELKLAHPIRE